MLYFAYFHRNKVTKGFLERADLHIQPILFVRGGNSQLTRGQELVQKLELSRSQPQKTTLKFTGKQFECWTKHIQQMIQK